MEKHFFFISLRKTLFLTATFVLLIGNTQPSYAMLGVDEELQVMQNGIVKGRIVDTNGEAVIGANVKLKGSNQGTITDVDGNFSLDYGHFDRIGSFSLFRASVLVSFNRQE